MNQEKKLYTNFGIKEIPEDLYYDPKYLGVIFDQEDIFCECYLVKKENEEVYVLIGKRENYVFMIDEIVKTLDMNDVLVIQMLRLNELSLDQRISLIKKKLGLRKILKKR